MYMQQEEDHLVDLIRMALEEVVSEIPTRLGAMAVTVDTLFPEVPPRLGAMPEPVVPKSKVVLELDEIDD